MKAYDKCVAATKVLLVVTIVNGFVVSRFAPRIGASVALGAYLLAGVTSMASIICTVKDV